MKSNSHKLLLWLYSENIQQPMVTQYDQLRLIVPDVTTAGLRSLVRNLVKQHLVQTDFVAQHTYIQLTRHGLDRLKGEFPALGWHDRAWSGQWSCLVFLQAPDSDPGFRYLRTLLLGEQAVQLGRGVYLSPEKFSDKVMTTCRELYVGAVAVFTISEWQFGDERSEVVHNFSLSAVAEAYSGISSEVNQLLQYKQNQKSSDDAFKQLFSSVFDRFYLTLLSDNGLTSHYFPTITPPVQLLLRLQRLLQN